MRPGRRCKKHLITGAGQDRAPKFGILAQLCKGAAHVAAHLDVYRIYLGLVERDFQNPASAGDFDIRYWNTFRKMPG
jgi:hypothetical protein